MFIDRFNQNRTRSIKTVLVRGLNWLDRVQENYQKKTAKIHPKPILILGHQKSGTTVIAALLGKISGKPVLIDPFHQFDLKAQLRMRLFQQEIDLSSLVQAHPFYFSTPIVKDPNFTFLYPQLRTCFPESQYIMVMRDPRDTIRSILNRLKIPGNLPELDATCKQKLSAMEAKGWQLMLEGHLPDVPGNSYIERLAHRWNIAAETYLNHRDSIILVRYEDFLQDKIGTLKTLAQRVNLNPNKDISDLVDIQYQPRGNRAVNLMEFFGQENSMKIDSICKTGMERLNYL
ncbi:sulfotransferase family protein [Lusitaniella coriacea]|uniref:sulfotransferase family protein n=1 Tax=Lusitaniella coriacea TaxID=1983105 RepID=UPI002D21D041|nr:sulfotransferase [Lusitaniella coriacea]